eukprot:665867-Rhodomonas_salina.1
MNRDVPERTQFVNVRKLEQSSSDSEQSLFIMMNVCFDHDCLRLGRFTHSQGSSPTVTVTKPKTQRIDVVLVDLAQALLTIAMWKASGLL